MSQRITIEIKNKIATCLTELPVVCGNADYEVEFAFDEEWNEHEIKTATFVVNGELELKVFSGNVCEMPVLQNTLIARIGVFAGTIDDGTLSTSTPAIVHCKPSATCGNATPAPPKDDVYNQIIKRINEIETPEIDTSELVPNTRTVNGKTLDEDITLTAKDVGALTSEDIDEAMEKRDAKIEDLETDVSSHEKRITTLEENPVDENAVSEAVSSWLEEHPEATTTIQDNSVTFKKLADEVGEKIKNHIVDPAFTDILNTSKVQFVYASNKSASNGILTFGKTSSGQFRANIKGDNSYVSGHIYYIDIQVKIDEPTLTNASTLQVGHPKGSILLNIVEGWQRVCAITKPTSTEAAYIKVGRDDKDTDPATIHVRCPILIDLTEVFGAGNEPSAENFAAILDGLHNIDTPTNGVFKNDYILKRLDNSTNIYAKNLLSEEINSKNNWGDVAQKVTGNGSYAVLQKNFLFSYQKIGTHAYSGNEGDVIYFAASALSEDESCSSLGLDIVSDMSTSNTKYGVYIDNPTPNTWYRLSTVFKHNGIVYPSIGFIYPNKETQSGKIMWFKFGILLNLTQIFGKGNEPSVKVIDTFLSAYKNGWFNNTNTIFNAEAMLHAFQHYNNIYDKSGYGIQDGRFVAQSIFDKYAPCWSIDKYKYGITNPEKVNIPHDFLGSVKTNGMFISDGEQGAWTTDASGQFAYGGHVFHGWNEIGTYRLSLMIGNSCVGDTPREDEAAILVYSPSNLFDNPSRELTEEQREKRITPNSEDYYGGNSRLLLGRIRIGSDVYNEGVVFQRKKTTFYGEVILSNSKKSANADSEGEVGTIRYTDDYLYICTSKNTWKRCKLETY